jgi:Zn-dependent protease
MFGSSFKIATVWGIPIRIHFSLILLLIYFGVSSGLLEGLRAVPFIMALELGTFTSIVLHELGHSFVAMRKGCRVREITLMFIGGAAQMERIPERPFDEFLMAIAGPLVSVVLGLLLWFCGSWIEVVDYLGLFRVTNHVTLNLLQVLGATNFTLALFNLIPAFPMDGGRVLRASLVRKKGRLGATRIAARFGKFVALLFGIYGFLSLPSGWYMLFIAFFLYSNAGREYRHVLRQHQMRSGGPAGWGGWPFGFGGAAEPPPLEDVATVSPPPYERGPHRETEIRSDRGGQ